MIPLDYKEYSDILRSHSEVVVPGQTPRRIAAAAVPREPAPDSRRRARKIMAERELLLTELDVLQALGTASQFSINAGQLLTRSWSAQSWPAREKLLRSASWLVRLEQRRGDPLLCRLKNSPPADAHATSPLYTPDLFGS